MTKQYKIDMAVVDLSRALLRGESLGRQVRELDRLIQLMYPDEADLQRIYDKVRK